MDNINNSKKTKAQMKAELRQIYENKFLSELKLYEEQRKKDRWAYYAFVSIFLIFLSIIIAPLRQLSIVFLFITIFLTILARKDGASKVINDDYEINLKNKLMPDFLSIFGTFSWSKYAKDNFTSMSKFIRSLKIFPKTLFLGFDDMIGGEYDGVDIEIIETRTGRFAFSILGALIFLFVLSILLIFILTSLFYFVIMIVGLISYFSNELAGIIFMLIILFFILSPFVIWILYSVINTSMRCVVVRIDLNKNVKGRTFLYEKLGTSEKLFFKHGMEYQPVKLEDIKFAKSYKVFSNDQVEARYLLTTAFMERFQNIKMAFKAKFMRAECKDGELVILIGVNKDLFAMGNISQKTTYMTFLELFEELYSVLELVDELKLNQNVDL